MSKIKIEIRKPQYLVAKEAAVEAKGKANEKKATPFFHLLLAATYVLSALAIWFVYQRYSSHS